MQVLTNSLKATIGQRSAPAATNPSKDLTQVPTRLAPVETPPAAEADVAELSDAAATSASRENGYLTEHFRALAQGLVEQVGGELTSLPASQLMFHGSAAKFDSVEARPNRRGTASRTDWEGTAIFAGMDARVGLHYTANRRTGVIAGIDLRNFTNPSQPLTYYLEGGADLNDAMNKVYGDPTQPESCLGYVHLLDKSKFVREPGLGSMEMITRDASANLGRLTLNRRAAIDALVKSGSVVVEWTPGDRSNA